MEVLGTFANLDLDVISEPLFQPQLRSFLLVTLTLTRSFPVQGWEAGQALSLSQL